ncbi:MAG TPA: Flp pilus assembly protein CpaB [Burkholderiaceae bacterium]|nr:Flp pilus assembly protein CpaB [Burkholderiaceae bacterium]
MKLKINKTWIVLGVALVVGGGAAFMANSYLRAQVEEIESRGKGDSVKLVVAKKDMPKGTTLSVDSLAVRNVPREWAHSNAVTPEQFDRIDRGALAYPAKRGEPLLWSQLEGDKVPTFSARVAAGRRAVTVPVDEISSISGLVEPGDRIDIMVTVRRDNRQLAFVLMQSVPVLATGTKVEQGSDGRDGSRRTFTTITLDVNAEQARQVIAAREIGKITALLRAPGDRGAVSGSRDDAAALLGLASPAPFVARRGVQIIYGGTARSQAIAPLPGASDARPAAGSAGAPSNAAPVKAAGADTPVVAASNH